MDSKAVINRRTAIGAALVAATPLLFPGRVPGARDGCAADTFVKQSQGGQRKGQHGT